MKCRRFLTHPFFFGFRNSFFIDYRHFDQNNIVPRYDFGFGLSYAKFAYTNRGLSQTSFENDTNTQLEAN
jgi:hypothetical protein